MIDQATINQILDAAKILEVVEDFVPLKRRGANYTGCCPFHNERTPSFSVSPSRNIYKCFGCGKAGNAVNFIMEHEKLNYPDALRYLAKKYHIEIVEKEQTTEDKLLHDKRESMLKVSTYAGRIFQENLFNNREGTLIGLSYFKERGFREEIIKKFELGYGLEARDAFTKKAMADGYKEEFLIETGLTIRGEHGLFDRFHGRVMFPIHSLSGQVIAFGGRILKTDKKVAKYFNSPESEIYHKSKVLYGIYHARKSIADKDKCFLVEGYTDVISMHQSGIENVVASSGTSLTVEQIQLIKRFTQNITVLYDSDPAGIKASLRGIDMILQEDMNVKVLLMPDGEDPDSFARTRSASELEEYVRKNETDFITFKATLLLDDAKGDPIKRAQLITEVVESIALIPKDITRMVYLKECSRMFEMDEQVLIDTANGIRRKKAEQTQRAAKHHAGEPSSNTIEYPESGPLPEVLVTSKEFETIERELVRLLINYGNEVLMPFDPETGEAEMTVAQYLISELRSDELNIYNPVLRAIFEEYERLSGSGVTVEIKHFTHHPDPEISKLSAGLIETKYVLSRIHTRYGTVVKTEEKNLVQVVPYSLIAYKHERIIEALKKVSISIQKAETEGNQELLDQLFAKYLVLTEVKKELANVLGKRVVM